MTTRSFSLIAIAAAFAVSSSAAMLQSARPALADADDHHARPHHQQRTDRDDRGNHARTNTTNGYWSNGQWYGTNNGNYRTNGNNNRNWNSYAHTNNGKHKGQKKHDRDDHR